MGYEMLSESRSSTVQLTSNLLLPCGGIAFPTHLHDEVLIRLSRFRTNIYTDNMHLCTTQPREVPAGT